MILKLLRENQLPELRVEIGDLKLYARRDAPEAEAEPEWPASEPTEVERP